jgi:hypothetical protein
LEEGGRIGIAGVFEPGEPVARRIVDIRLVMVVEVDNSAVVREVRPEVVVGLYTADRQLVMAGEVDSFAVVGGIGLGQLAVYMVVDIQHLVSVGMAHSFDVAVEVEWGESVGLDMIAEVLACLVAVERELEE